MPLDDDPDPQPSADNINCQWKHELDHDTESVFWLLLYWAVCAQPEQSREEAIDPFTWLSFTERASSRIVLIRARTFDGSTRSFYRPLWPLLEVLSYILNVDRHWPESDLSDPRNDPEYLNEAFQRLILQFILDNRNKEFMKRKIEPQLRQPMWAACHSPSKPR